MKSARKNILKDEQGFTLIEIIAVLIILGVLAAVAVPKFVDMSSEAELKAVEGALSAGMSTVALQFARLTLSNSSAPAGAALATAATASGPATDDFDYTFTASGNDVIVKSTWSAASGRTGSSSKTWKSPNT